MEIITIYTDDYSVSPSNITVGEWLDTWLMEYKQPSVRVKTFEGYEYLIRLHIKPVIGDIMLKDLKTEQLQKLYNDKFRSGLSSRPVQTIHITMHNALSQAVKNGLILRNVSEATTLPKGQKKEIRILSMQEQQLFMKACERERLGLAFLLDLNTGLRLGELLALRWQDINLPDGLLTVRQSLCATKTQGLIFQEPKTKAGKRTIPLTKSVKEALEAFKHDHDLVFCNDEGNPIYPRNFTRIFYRIIENAGLEPINFHALRHSFASRMLELNIHPKVVQELLGHSDVSITLNTYTHVMPQVKYEAIQKLENHVGSKQDFPD